MKPLPKGDDLFGFAVLQRRVQPKWDTHSLDNALYSYKD